MRKERAQNGDKMKKKRVPAMRVAVILALSLLLQGCGEDKTGMNQVQTSEGTETLGETEPVADAVRETETELTADADKENREEQEKQPEEMPEPEEKAGTEGLATPASCGALRVEGTYLTDEEGNPVQLKGISTHGLSWFPEYVNKDCLKQLREEWNANVIRLAMYTAESGGYCTDGDKEKLKQLIHNGVAYATELDMYVIIDWHILSDNNPNTYKEEAKKFFAEMAETYADYDNVIYEICNEPNGGTGWSEIKSYAEEVIPVIRQYDDEAVIIVGTPNWSQYVNEAAADPITDYDNIMYALHFYAATHTDTLRNTMTAAIDAGLPVFVSEYGICDASGNGGIDEYQANEWVKTMNSYQVSYVVWSLSNKNETASMINSSCTKTSGFSEEDLSACGKWVYAMLTGKNAAELQGTAGTSGQSNAGVVQDTAGNGQDAPENVRTGAQTALTDGDIQVLAEVANSWEAEGKTFYQYNLTVQNTSAGDCTNWNITLHFSSDISFSDGWNGHYTANGSALQISNADYNGSIAAGGCVKDIGFIISGASGMTVSQ